MWNSSDPINICRKNKYYKHVCDKYSETIIKNGEVYKNFPEIHMKIAVGKITGVGKKTKREKIFFSKYVPKKNQSLDLFINDFVNRLHIKNQKHFDD
jgi:hypothetical protein